MVHRKKRKIPTNTASNRERKTWFYVRRKDFPTLPPGSRRVLEVYIQKGASLQSTARDLECSTRWVQIALRNCKANLEKLERKRLTETGKGDYIEAMVLSRHAYHALKRLKIHTRSEARRFMTSLLNNQDLRNQFLANYPWSHSLFKSKALRELVRQS